MTKMYKMIFLISLMSGTIMSISSYTWMGMWMGLEVNLLSIIPLLSNQKNSRSSESSMKYFITQALASTVLIFSVIMMMTKNNTINNLDFSNTMMIMLNSALLTKMGAAPFHFWFPEVLEGMSWMNCMIVLTWQKIAPMVLMMYNMKMIYFMTMIIICSMMISGIMGISQTSMRKILAYSSINHTAWMISSMMFIESVWTFYFIIYSIISLNIIIILSMFNIFYIKQIISSLNNSKMMKLFFITNFLSLGGLPPFLGFFPKWLTIQVMIENQFFITPFMMILTNLITLYFYMRITFSTMLMASNEISWTIKIKKNWKIKLTLTMNFLSMIGLMWCTFLFNWM